MMAELITVFWGIGVVILSIMIWTGLASLFVMGVIKIIEWIVDKWEDYQFSRYLQADNKNRGTDK